MVLMPALGAYADLRAAKKRLLLLATAGCVAHHGDAGVGPGDLALAVVPSCCPTSATPMARR
jgi:UMF1 family MFS transporter